jgi:hypothetical protein
VGELPRTGGRWSSCWTRRQAAWAACCGGGRMPGGGGGRPGGGGGRMLAVAAARWCSGAIGAVRVGRGAPTDGGCTADSSIGSRLRDLVSEGGLRLVHRGRSLTEIVGRDALSRAPEQHCAWIAHAPARPRALREAAWASRTSIDDVRFELARRTRDRSAAEASPDPVDAVVHAQRSFPPPHRHQMTVPPGSAESAGGMASRPGTRDVTGGRSATHTSGNAVRAPQTRAISRAMSGSDPGDCRDAHKRHEHVQRESVGTKARLPMSGGGLSSLRLRRAFGSDFIRWSPGIGGVGATGTRSSRRRPAAVVRSMRPVHEDPLR